MNIQHPTSNTQHPMRLSHVREVHWMLDVGCWMLGVGCWVLDVGLSPSSWPRLSTLAALGMIAFLASPADAQSILLRDGKRVVAKALRRQGDSIMAQSPKVDANPEVQGEVGYPLAQIERLEFPEPAVLKTAPDMIAQGRAADALGQLDSTFNYYAGFRDAPGSWWADVAMLKLAALVSLSKDGDADPLARQIAGQAQNPETVRAAQAHLAGIEGRRGEHARAIKLCDEVLREGTTPATLAVAAINKAHSHLALKQWDHALLAYLQIPVFYPEQKAFTSQYLLGAGRCYFELEDYARAKDSLNSLLKDFAATNEATLAKAELDKIARRQKALEGVK